MKTTNTLISPAPPIPNRKCLFFALVLTSLPLGFTLPQVQASPIVVPNFSFESPDVADGLFSLVIPDWSYMGSGAFQAGVYDHNDAGFPGATGGNLPAPALGAQSAFLHTGGLGGVSMTTTSALTSILPETTYTLTVAIGVRLDFPAGPANGGGSLNLFANGVNVSGSELNFNVNTLPRGAFADYTISFTTGTSDFIIGQSLTPFIGIFFDGSSGINVDNVRLDATSVPEPTTVTLLLSASLLAMNRRKRPMK